MEKQFAIANSQIILISALKDYEANWLDGGQKVTRDESGKFASKSSSTSTADSKTDALGDYLKDNFKKLPKSEQNRLSKALDVSKKTLDELADNFDKMSPEDQKTLKEFIESSNYQRGVREVGKRVSQADPEAGKVFDRTLTKIEGTIKKESRLSGAIKAIGGIVKQAVETAKEHPEIVLAGAMAAGLAVAGGAGAVALFSLPNLFGVGGIWSGLSAAMGGEAIATITSAFATGGLSQLGFSACAYIAIAETMVLSKDLGVLFNKDLKKEYENALKEAGEFAKGMKVELKKNQDKMISDGFATNDGYATPKYIEHLKEAGLLKADYPKDKPYKIPYWDA